MTYLPVPTYIGIKNILIKIFSLFSQKKILLLCFVVMDFFFYLCTIIMGELSSKDIFFYCIFLLVSMTSSFVSAIKFPK